MVGTFALAATAKASATRKATFRSIHRHIRTLRACSGRVGLREREADTPSRKGSREAHGTPGKSVKGLPFIGEPGEHLLYKRFGAYNVPRLGTRDTTEHVWERRLLGG
jgi:hypothetical protein